VKVIGYFRESLFIWRHLDKLGEQNSGSDVNLRSCQFGIYTSANEYRILVNSTLACQDAMNRLQTILQVGMVKILTGG
jgi:hypothetical protein